MTKPLSVGVLGGGVWGSNLIRACAHLNVLSGVCDPDPAAVEKVRENYPGVLTESDTTRFLEGPFDAVIIAAPAPLHAQLAIKAMRSGKHVFVEKPLALTVEDGLAVAAAAEQTGKVAFVGHLLLYHPGVLRMLDLIEEGAIGDMWHVRSRRLSLGRVRAQENVWWSFAPHDVSVCLAFFKDEPTDATAFTSSVLSPAIADVAYAQYAFPGGRSAHIEVHWLDPEKGWRIDAFGTLGVLTLTDTRESGAKLTLTPCGGRASGGAGHDLWRDPPVNVAIPGGEPLQREINAFIGAVQHGAAFPTDASHGVAVLRALAMAERATRHTAKESLQTV